MCRADGMLTIEQSLAELVRTGRISRDEAFDHSHHPEDLQRHLS
jgi:twitching motility protein PilT